MLVLTERDVARLLDMDAALAAVRAAQVSVHRGAGANLPKARATAGDLTLHAIGAAVDLGLTDLTGAVDGAGGAGVVAGVKAYVSGSARGHGVLLFDERDGLAAAVSAVHLGRLRTGAATRGSVAARAPAAAATLGIIGAGRQAFTQVEAVSRVRALTAVVVASRTGTRAPALAQRIEAELGVAARPGPVAEAVAADVVVAVTTTGEPVVRGADLSPDAHVVLAGSSHVDRREADAEVFAGAAVVTADDPALARAYSGDLRAAVAAAAIGWDDVRSLGWALDRPEADRTGITVFCSHGIGSWDVALAAVAVMRARERGIGTWVDNTEETTVTGRAG